MDVKEFNILGHSIKLKESQEVGAISPDDIVAFVRNDAIKIKQASPNLKDSQIAVLLALQYVSEKATLEKEYKESIFEFEKMTSEALQFIEEVTPSTH